MSNRTSIKSHFRTGDIPTQDNFYDFIDSVLNQDEDGITKKAGNPVSIQAEGDINGVQNVLFFYRSLADENPSWKISQNPRSDPQNATTNKPGLNFSDGASGASRLFIKSGDTSIGIGTIEPAANLHIKGSGVSQVLIGDWKKGGNYAGLSLNGAIDDLNYNILSAPTDKNFYLNRPNGYDIRFRKDNADQMVLSNNGNLGIGTTTPQAKLQVVGGAIQPAAGNAATAGIQFPNDPGGGGNDAAWIRYYARAGEACTLEIGVANDGDDHISLMPSGNVGIGTLNPAYKLHVAGPVSLGGFSPNDADEWPNVVWYRDGAASWDEGLIKGNSAKGVYGRAGFGIHMHESRHFGFYSTNWNPLVDIEGGTGRTYVKGKLTIGAVGEALAVENAGVLVAKNAGGGYEGFLWPRWIDNAMYTNYGTGGFYLRNNGSTVTMYMTNDNRVGIGTTAPRAKLEVSGSVVTRLAYAFLNRSGQVGTGTWDTAVSIWASNRIVAEEFNAVSDSRIKTNIAASDGKHDLQALARLQVVDYHLKEYENDPAGKKKGFLAQQVEKILPGAVYSHPDFTPSIFALPQNAELNNGVLTVTTAEEHQLAGNDLVRLVTPTGNKDVKVSVVNKNVFTVADWAEDSAEIFVYGKQVNDFRTLNYDHIFCVGISAIQELYRQMQQLKEEVLWAKEKLLQYSLH